ncbi:dTDP-glucose 4,6-dehydratase [Candidatus Gracilibacteria bacterium CG17_big_fil_post_rev_8_21_14_2_50_48_13]|nr:MAG: dTDP-glucose 4,6-dehydratase [Candidatus Gracilibacteria bacterium CG17_big_fil_post_rev_8_21_14_2_50_48_13]
MHLLVTGGLGFIGSNFVRYWHKHHGEDSITILDKKTYAVNPKTEELLRGELGDRLHIVEGDICDMEKVWPLVDACDIVVHFAAESHVDRSVMNPSVFLTTNVMGTFTLLEAAVRAGKKRFHHVSTDEVFGTLPLDSKEKFTEKSPYDPRSPYSASKAASDHLVRAYHETYGLPVTISNCTNNYGPLMFPEKVMPLYITRLFDGKPIPVYGKGLAVRDYIWVDDHARGIELCIQKGVIGQTYLFGGDAERTTNEVAQTIARQLGADPSLIRHTVDRPGHDPRYAIDFSKATAELGWSPSRSFDEGIAQMIAWYKANEAWWRPLMHDAEQLAEKYLQGAI